MKRFALILSSALLLLTGMALAQDNTEIKLAESEAGAHLVDVNGQPLYLFLPDEQRTSTCTEECLEQWEPVELVGGIGVDGGVQIALIGTIELEDGTIQVTYNLWPLYRYVGDATADEDGTVTPAGHGLDDAWYLVTVDGDALGLEQ